jgi:hypothetical protein
MLKVFQRFSYTRIKDNSLANELSIISREGAKTQVKEIKMTFASFAPSRESIFVLHLLN